MSGFSPPSAAPSVVRHQLLRAVNNLEEYPQDSPQPHHNESDRSQTQLFCHNESARSQAQPFRRNESARSQTQPFLHESARSQTQPFRRNESARSQTQPFHHSELARSQTVSFCHNDMQAQHASPLARPPRPSAALPNFWNIGSRVGKRKASVKKPSSKKKKIATWTHTFVCLANVEDDSIPDGDYRAELQLAGLGEKRICFLACADVHEIFSELSYQYPQLVDAGGFELLRVPEGGGKQLDVIVSPENGYTASYLKAVVHHAKIYIRPLQKSLPLDPQKEEVPLELPKEACMMCGAYISVTSLREHIAGCKKRGHGRGHSGQESEQSSSSRRQQDEECEGRGNSSVQDEEREGCRSRECEVVNLDAEVEDVHQSLSRSPSPILQDSEDDPVLDVALHVSKTERVKDDRKSSTEAKSIKDVVLDLVERRGHQEEFFPMVVRRSNVLCDALRRMQRISFNPEKAIEIHYTGEDGSDTGGLTREFFRLVGYSIGYKFLDSAGAFVHNAIAYQEGVYSRLGTLVAMALVHGGGPVRLFCPSVFRYFCGMNPTDIIVELREVADEATNGLLQQMRESSDVKTLHSLAMENIDLLVECGFTKPVSQLKIDDKVDLIQTIALHKVILASLAELCEFRNGLATLGVGDALRKHGPLLHSFFCNDIEVVLTSDDIRTMFNIVRYSEKGSNERQKEEAAYMFFIDFLDDCEKVQHIDRRREIEDVPEEMEASAHSDVSLAMVMSFFTGADSVPPLGLPEAVLNFNPNNVYPTASTCAIELTLPTKYTRYEDFRQSMTVAMTMHGGFGKK